MGNGPKDLPSKQSYSVRKWRMNGNDAITNSLVLRGWGNVYRYLTLSSISFQVVRGRSPTVRSTPTSGKTSSASSRASGSPTPGLSPSMSPVVKVRRLTPAELRSVRKSPGVYVPDKRDKSSKEAHRLKSPPVLQSPPPGKKKPKPKSARTPSPYDPEEGRPTHSSPTPSYVPTRIDKVYIFYLLTMYTTT